MKEEEVLKLMVDIGPNAKDAVGSWVSLQWIEFWVGVIGNSIGFLLLGVFLYVAIIAIKAIASLDS